MRKGVFNRTRGGLALTFTLTVISIFVIAQGTLWVGFLVSQKNLYRENLRNKTHEIASLVAEVSARSIRQGRISDLNFYLEKVASGNDVINVKVTDGMGRIVSHASGSVQEANKWTNPFFIHWENTLEVPVLIDGLSDGNVIITYSGKAVNDDMLDLLLIPPMWQILVFVIVVAMIFAFTNSVIGRPIEILKERMTRVTSGDLTVDIPDVGSREISEVADGLRFLVKGMSLNVTRLMHVTKSISEAIVSLKLTFKNTTDRVKNLSLSTNQIAGSMKLADESQGKIKENATNLSGLINDNLSSVLEIKSRETEILGSMERLFSSVDNSYSVVAEMSQTSKVMMQNASKVLGSVENTSASVEEIIASVREVETSARESSRLADDVRNLAARKGVVTVDKAITGMNMISEKVNSAVDIVRRLDKRSKDVQKVLAFIKDITEKTNLLSINASILAEQAGEYGKGFSVVADQMRSLSTRTEEYTREISSIVKMIQSEIGDVVSAIEQGNEIVKEGSSSVYEVGETMSSILDSSNTSANMAKTIERATEAQVLALRHMEKSIIDVNSMALEMNTAMSEMYKSSGFLFDRMGEVRDVAEGTMKGSDDLANGVRFISQNLETSAGGVRGIEEAISLQRHQGGDILKGVESIRNEGVWIISDLEGLSVSIERLKDEFDTLRNEMGSFRIR